MTVTGYNTYVQDIKNEMLEAADKNLNSQKQYAFVTINNGMDKFIQFAMEIFEEFGYIVHWYHYGPEALEQLDIELEIDDLTPHYEEVFVFEKGKLDFVFIRAAAISMRNLMELANPHSICVLGNDECIARLFTLAALDENRKTLILPFGKESGYGCIFESDMSFIVDSRYHINCYPIHKPIVKIFPWTTINDDNREVYDITEEIILRVIQNVC